VSFPAPRPGLVIRYAFLWSHEQDAGADEAAKARPCAVVVAAPKLGRGIRTLVAPITHAPPEDEADSIEIPSAVAKALCLDEAPHWLRLDELNLFTWPGYDLRPIPETGRYDYGMLPQDLFEALRKGIVERQAVKKARTQGRD
jgi:hypothetical protein